MAYEFQHVRVEMKGNVAIMTIDRPPVNALNSELFLEIGRCADEVALDDNIRAVVLTGGEKHFVAGADIKEMVDITPTDVSKFIKVAQSSLTKVENIAKPVIAAVNGFALGGGCELAICADWIFMHEKATIGVPEILLGIIPGAGGTQRLPRRIGPAKAKEMIFSGKFYNAQDAFELGLVQKVVKEEDSVIEVAVKIASRYAKGASTAIAMAKTAVNKGLNCSIEDGLALEAQCISLCFATDDQKTGMKTFLKEGPGKAEFTGK